MKRIPGLGGTAPERRGSAGMCGGGGTAVGGAASRGGAARLGDGCVWAPGWQCEGRLEELRGPCTVLESLTVKEDAAKCSHTHPGGRGALGKAAPREAGGVRLSKAIRPPPPAPVGPRFTARAAACATASRSAGTPSSSIRPLC